MKGLSSAKHDCPEKSYLFLSHIKSVLAHRQAYWHLLGCRNIQPSCDYHWEPS